VIAGFCDCAVIDGFVASGDSRVDCAGSCGLLNERSENERMVCGLLDVSGERGI
jgi:hypothetical protein